MKTYRFKVLGPNENDPRTDFAQYRKMPREGYHPDTELSSDYCHGLYGFKRIFHGLFDWTQPAALRVKYSSGGNRAVL